MENNGFMFRLIIVAGLFFYIANADNGGGGGDNPTPNPNAPYTGTMAAVHTASREMPDNARAAMAYAFDTGADMLRADSTGLVNNTDVAQEYALAFLTFSYNGIGKPAERYPATADAIEAELSRVYGTEIVPVDAAKRSQIADAFDEIGRAVR